jgi:transcriptional regulator with XRE-family HTH domain
MPTMDANTLLVALLDDISKAGFSVAQICKAANVDPSLVSRWKGGRVEPRLSSLVRLEAALELLKTQQ